MELWIDYKKEFIVGEGRDRKKDFKILEVILKETVDEKKEEKKIPYPIGTSKGFKLWKFFMSYKNGAMRLLEEPRYKLQKGYFWFDITSMMRMNEWDNRPGCIIEDL